MMLGCLVIRTSPTSANAGCAVVASTHAMPKPLNHRFINIPLPACPGDSLRRRIATASTFALARERLGVRWIGARQRPALLDFLQHEDLEQLLLACVARDF